MEVLRDKKKKTMIPYHSILKLSVKENVKFNNNDDNNNNNIMIKSPFVLDYVKARASNQNFQNPNEEPQFLSFFFL